MFNQISGKVTYIPFNRDRSEGYSGDKERRFASVLEGLYWQTLGWVHTPPFITVEQDRNIKIETPKSTAKYEKFRFHAKESFKPKLQIENKVPYGVLPKDVVTDIKMRQFAQEDFKTILDQMGIETAAILPSVLIYNDKVVIVKEECSEGIPQHPFLDLDLFDDFCYFDTRSDEEWLSLGDAASGRKSLPALALVPEHGNDMKECLNFDWNKVKVLDYDAEKKLFLVKIGLNPQEDDNSSSDVNDTAEMWIPRIYLKFDAEEPLQFAKRLQTSLLTRHIVEESLRISYYVECIPLENSPEWSATDLDIIVSIVRRSRALQVKLQWIKDHLIKNIKEIQLEYTRAYNYICYNDIAKQIPHSIKDFKNENLLGMKCNPNTNIQNTVPFKKVFESFRCQTFYTCIEAVQALSLVESNILALRNLSLYNLPLNDIYTLEKFDALQRTELQNISKYIHETWMSEISNAILFNLKNCGKGSYDLNQTVQHTFQRTKLGKLLKMVEFKMQDVIRFLIMESLEKYSTMIQTACVNVIDIKNNYVWEDTLASNKLSPFKNPIFEVPLEIKGDRLKFVVNLQKYGDAVRELFEDGLRVTKDLPKIEKFTMKRMLYNPDDKLDTVEEKEKEVVQWKTDIIRGMDQAIVAATAYIHAYDVPLKTFKTDQINYVKHFARMKANCDQLKQVIEMHNNEKIHLENTIPAFVDIGPFRLITQTVRTAAIKKHEQLADAVLGYFYGKLRQLMESINNQFLMLLDRIDQPTGNIEGLMEKKQWCRTVPKKTEKLSIEVNRLRFDLKLISTFHQNMDDEDFHTFWQVQRLPQETMKRLQYRISIFDDEKKQHREHLSSDQAQLKVHLKLLRAVVGKFPQYSDIENAQTIATEVRKARKNLTKYEEQSQLYQKRERLFGLPTTKYDEISEISNALVPYEHFWLSAAEFKKYKERDLSNLLTIDPSQLREVIEEFHSNLQSSLEFFTPQSYADIHNAIISVLSDVEEFIATRLSNVSTI